MFKKQISILWVLVIAAVAVVGGIVLGTWIQHKRTKDDVQAATDTLINAAQTAASTGTAAAPPSASKA